MLFLDPNLREFSYLSKIVVEIISTTTVLERSILLHSMTVTLRKKIKSYFIFFLGTSGCLFPHFSLQGNGSFLLYMSLYLIITIFFLIFLAC